MPPSRVPGLGLHTDAANAAAVRARAAWSPPPPSPTRPDRTQVLVTAFLVISLACRGATVVFVPFNVGFESLRVAHMVSIVALVAAIEYLLVLKVRGAGGGAAVLLWHCRQMHESALF